MGAILKIQDLHTHFFTKEGVVKALNGVNLELEEGKVTGLVGESGCGKTVTALSILRLVPYPGKIMQGHIYYQGADLLTMEEEKLRRIRGMEVAIAFQDATTALNPVLSIGEQLIETFLSHLDIPRAEATQRAVAIMRIMGLPEPRRMLNQYTFHLSGGMNQRVMMAIALALDPRILIADEPTTGLDVTLQAHLLDLMSEIQAQRGMTMLLITHDLGVVARVAERTTIMYAGSIVEEGDTRSIFRQPLHPYTWALMQAIPRIDTNPRRLHTMRGTPPDMIDLGELCPFLPRCPKATVQCRVNPIPPMEEVAPGRKVACYNPVRHDW